MKRQFDYTDSFGEWLKAGGGKKATARHSLYLDDFVGGTV